MDCSRWVVDYLAGDGVGYRGFEGHNMYDMGLCGMGIRFRGSGS